VLSSIAMAVSLFDESLKLAARSAEPCDLLQARVLAWRSRCRRRQRDWDAAREDVERALELAEGLNDKHALANLNLQASLIAERNGQWVRSRSYAERARTLFEELSDRRSYGLMLNNLGGLQYLLGKPDEAVKYLTDAFGVALDLGDEIEAARAVSSLAQVHLGTGKPDVAESQARKALEMLTERADTTEDCGSAHLVLGRALIDQGRLDEAGQELEMAESLLAQLSSASHVAAAWIAKGDLAQAQGDDASAARLYRRAAESLQDYRF
jgi:tetratricopeptide (TPR) repeat protein